jgi:serine/threonine protein kinase
MQPKFSGATRLSRSDKRSSYEGGKQAVIQVGAVIRHRFLLEKEIGRGGMGVVYLARDLRKEEVGDQDSRIAIKLLSEDFKQYPESLKMLQQESRKAQKLAHPNVVTVYDFDRDGETVYMTMEYLSGYPLDKYIEEYRYTPPSIQEALPIITDIVNGLEYAHQQGVVHSDLKPGNIFINDKGVAKILDFGIARAVMKSETTVEKTVRSYSDDNGISIEDSSPDISFALTPGYASLAMFEGKDPDPRDDLYALACITYELLSGQHPYGNLPANEAYKRGLSPTRIDGLNDRQWKVLLKGLAFENDKRIGSAKEFLEGFSPRKKEPWKFIAAAITAMTIVSSSYFLLRLPPETSLSTDEKVIVEEELRVARESLEVGALGLAFENYKMILALPPYDKHPPGKGFVQQAFNRKAMRGFDELLLIFEAQASRAIDENRLADAEGFIEAGISVPSAEKRFIKMKNKLEKLR